jgi:hypothetical protein
MRLTIHPPLDAKAGVKTAACGIGDCQLKLDLFAVYNVMRGILPG